MFTKVENNSTLCVCVKLLQSCPTLCDPMDHSLPGSSVHEIFQAWILKWVAMTFSRGSSWPRDWTCISYLSCIGSQFLHCQCHLESPTICQFCSWVVANRNVYKYSQNIIMSTSWWKWKGEWKSWLKTQCSKTKMMASGPITSQQIEGETMETVTVTLFSGAPKSLQMATQLS